AGDGDIAETGVEQVWVNACVSIYQDALCGEALGTVTCDSVAVVKMTVLTGVEFYTSVVVKARGNLSIRSEGLYDSKVAIGDAQPLVGSSELNTVAQREVARDFSIDVHSGESARVVIRYLARSSLD